MGKRILNLYVDDELITSAKARQMNLSSLFCRFLEIELGVMAESEYESHETQVLKLKSKSAMLSEQLKLKAEENGILQKEIRKLKDEVEIYKRKAKPMVTKTLNFN